jgi:hypothetical protein
VVLASDRQRDFAPIGRHHFTARFLLALASDSLGFTANIAHERFRLQSDHQAQVGIHAFGTRERTTTSNPLPTTIPKRKAAKSATTIMAAFSNIKIQGRFPCWLTKS